MMQQRMIQTEDWRGGGLRKMIGMRLEGTRESNYAVCCTAGELQGKVPSTK